MITTILSLLEISIKAFHDERQDRFLKRYIKLKKEYQDEINKGLDNRSDYALDKLRIEAELLSELVISEHSNR